MLALEADLANVKTVHAPLAVVSARSEADATKARADLIRCMVRLGEVELASK